MASFPGNTVWQKATFPLALFLQPTDPVPSTQYGFSGKGFSISPFLLQYNPPFYPKSGRSRDPKGLARCAWAIRMI